MSETVRVAGEWREIELGELCTRVTSGGTPKRSRADYFADDDGHVWIKSSELADRYVRSSSERISTLGLEESSAKVLPRRSVLVAMYGATAGRVGLLEVDAAVNQAVCALILDPQVADPVFVFHALRHRYADLAGKAAGAAQQNLNAQIIKSFKINVPTQTVQRRAGAVLSAFDELVEINERRIAVLEHLAGSLYREWFVRLRYPGHEAVSLVDSEVGLIPEQWTIARVAEITSTLTRGISPKYADDGLWTVLNQKCIRDHRVNLAPSRQQERDVPAAKRVLFGDVLVNSTGVGTLGRVAMYLGDHPALATDTHVTIVRPSADYAKAWFGLHMHARQSELEALGTGSTGQTELSRQSIAELPIVVPSSEILRAFGDRAWPILKSVPVLLERNAHLASTRDLLLPRLVTGRLDISDVDLGVLAPTEVA